MKTNVHYKTEGEYRNLPLKEHYTYAQVKAALDKLKIPVDDNRILVTYVN